MAMQLPPEPLGILLIAGTHERAHYAFVLATGAAAIGRAVTLFATNDGCRALLRDWSSLDGAARDTMVRARGVAGLDDLRDAARDLGVRLLACDSGLVMAGLGPEALIDEAEVAGVPTFLAAVGTGAIITL